MGGIGDRKSRNQSKKPRCYGEIEMKLIPLGDHVINPEAIDVVLFTPGGLNTETKAPYPPSTTIVMRSGERIPCPLRPADFAEWLAEKATPKETTDAN
jgi:hypothetical protein